MPFIAWLADHEPPPLTAAIGLVKDVSIRTRFGRALKAMPEPFAVPVVPAKLEKVPVLPPTTVIEPPEATKLSEPVI
jgi:hypothetical protein